mmetsp:Transcript_27846/g.59276  ORF Transcript_27846/g.59276 Transcript_27846/m.59276 type:complete len:126 (-) Transcript_27846:22-399(-)
MSAASSEYQAMPPAGEEEEHHGIVASFKEWVEHLRETPHEVFAAGAIWFLVSIFLTQVIQLNFQIALLLVVLVICGCVGLRQLSPEHHTAVQNKLAPAWAAAESCYERTLAPLVNVPPHQPPVMV